VVARSGSGSQAVYGSQDGEGNGRRERALSDVAIWCQIKPDRRQELADIIQRVVIVIVGFVVRIATGKGEKGCCESLFLLVSPARSKGLNST